MIVFDFDIAMVQSCEDRILEDIDSIFCTLSNELRKDRLALLMQRSGAERALVPRTM